MNKIIPLSTEYLHPSRTIEICNLVGIELSKLVFIYNYEGIHFRFFESMIGLIQFFEMGKEPEKSFLKESELEEFLEEYPINY